MMEHREGLISEASGGSGGGGERVTELRGQGTRGNGGFSEREEKVEMCLIKLFLFFTALLT